MKIANVRKFLLLNFVCFVVATTFLSFVIVAGATKETTWVDAVGIPAGIAVVVLAVGNAWLFLGIRIQEKRSAAAQQDEDK